MVAIYALMMLIGVRSQMYIPLRAALTYDQASLAPVAARYVAQSQGFRWIWWWCAIFLGVTFLAFVFFYEETKYVPLVSGGPPSAESTPASVDSDGSAAKQDISKFEELEPVVSNATTMPKRVNRRSSWVNPAIRPKSYRQRLALYTKTPSSFTTLARHLYQPFQALVYFPAVAFAAIQYGCVLAWLSMTVTMVAAVFPGPPYYYGSNMIGLMSLPGFIGSFLGAIVSGPCCDWLVIWLAKRNNGIFEPEMRLILFFIPTLVGPAGLWLFGHSLANVSYRAVAGSLGLIISIGSHMDRAIHWQWPIRLQQSNNHDYKSHLPF